MQSGKSGPVRTGRSILCSQRTDEECNAHEPVVYTQKHGMDFFEKLWPGLNELTKVGIHISGGFTNA